MTIFADDLALLRAIYIILLVVGILITLYNTTKITEVHKSMNSRLDQLLISATNEARASGVLEERERTLAREASQDRNNELDEATKNLPAEEIERLAR